MSNSYVRLSSDGQPVVVQGDGPDGGDGTAQIKSLLGNITNLSDDELNELRDLILQQLDTPDDDPDDVYSDQAEMDRLQSLAAAATAVKREWKRRDANVGKTRDAKAILASFRRESGQTAVVPDGHRPQGWRRAGRTSAVTAGGSPIGDRESLGRELVDVLRRTAIDPRQGRTRVATLSLQRPPERVLRGDDAMAITAALDGAAEEHIRFITTALSNPTALTAAGGLGVPEQPDYTLPGFEVPDRPVRASLPTFTTERGGVRFVMPPTLADVQGAVGIWDLANDIAAATNPAVRKPSLRVTVGNEVVVSIQAITSILTFGNLLARAYPEHVTRVTELALAAHARIAEQQLLTQIGALSTAVSGASNEGGNLGATRVLLPLLDRAACAMRDRLRMGKDMPLQMILPEWSEGILRSDLAMQEPGDTALGVTDSDLMSYFAARQLAPTWALDGEAGQQFDPQNPGPVNQWPTSVVGYMFPAGSFQFLDGGELDLGIIRDAELNAANDFQLFSESFESVLFRGGEAFRISQALTPSGITRAAA